MTRSRHPFHLVAVLLACVLAHAGPAHALTSAQQTFTLTFTLTDIEWLGDSAPEFILDDVEIIGQGLPNPLFVNESGTGTATGTRANSFAGAPLGEFDDFFLEIGDTFSTTQVQDATVTGLGEAFVSETFGWDLGVDNQTLEDLVLFFDWSYTRDITLVEMGPSDTAFVLLPNSTAVIMSEDNDQIFPDQSLFPDQLIPGNQPLNIGTVPPGASPFITDSGSFTIDAFGSSSDFTNIGIEWVLSANAEALPEPGTIWLLAAGLTFLAWRRR